jgi:hypothetical protein
VPKQPAIQAIALSPRLGAFNEDLRTFGVDELRAALRIQLVPANVVRFLPSGSCGQYHKRLPQDRAAPAF